MRGKKDMARFTWEQMVQQFPDQWVAVKEAEMDGGDIISGEVVCAKPDEEMRSFRAKNRKCGFVFRRTSEGTFNGFIDSDIKIAVN